MKRSIRFTEEEEAIIEANSKDITPSEFVRQCVRQFKMSDSNLSDNIRQVSDKFNSFNDPSRVTLVNGEFKKVGQEPLKVMSVTEQLWEWTTKDCQTNEEIEERERYWKLKVGDLPFVMNGRAYVFDKESGYVVDSGYSNFSVEKIGCPRCKGKVIFKSGDRVGCMNCGYNSDDDVDVL